MPSETNQPIPLDNPVSRRLSRTFGARNLAWRLFFTCWLIFGLHFSTEIVREIYPAVALGDHVSFRVDEYAGLHPDIFEKEGYGWHIGNNPGVSMLAAVPYALARPVIDEVVEAVEARRARRDADGPPEYDTPWANEREFFAEAWRQGLDVKLGLAAFVMQFFCMAPISAMSAVAVFFLLRRLLDTEPQALSLALLYAVGTPVFFRTGFLNHNLMLGIFSFLGFYALWDPGDALALGRRARFALAGLAGGTAVLFDYSGLVFLGGLFLYGMVLRRAESGGTTGLVRSAAWYAVGAAGPILLLWFYQWQSFGHPFLPGQHWMPPVQWIEEGYQGYGWPQLELLGALVLDHRFGLFTSSPLLLLALAAPFVDRGSDRRLPLRECAFTLLLFLGLWVFFGGSHYTRLQYNTGVRYMTPIIPFLFLPVAVVLVRMRRWAVYLLGAGSVGLSWCLAMYREVERPLGVLDPVVQTLVGGLQLPALDTLERLGGAYGGFASQGTSPLPLFLLAAVLIWFLWSPRVWDAPSGE